MLNHKFLSALGTTEETDPYFSNVSLLLHGDGTNGSQNNTFVDSSSNNFAITRYGNATQGSLSPFGNGWSAYFDGTGDYLTMSGGSNLALGTDDFTVEFWVYMTSVANQQVFFDTRSSGTSSGSHVTIYMQGAGKQITYYTSGVNAVTGSALTQSTWYHIALAREASNSRLFVNGVQVGSTYVDSSEKLCGANRPVIGVDGNTPTTGAVSGYISNLRILKGTALYTSNFTPPATPLTAITNTSLLLKFENAGIFDSAKKHNLETVGNAQVSTSVKKFGTGAMYFDGTGDWLLVPGSANNGVDFVGGSFTVETFVYPITGYKSTLRVFTTSGGAIGWNSTTGIHSYLVLSNTGELVFQYFNGSSGVGFASGKTVPLNSWSHIAVSYDKATSKLRLFLDGSMVEQTATVSRPSGTPTGMIGQLYGDSSSSYAYQGYIDDLRITKGVARYTADFTPPTRAFPDK